MDVQTKNTHQFVEGQTHFGMSRDAKMSLAIDAPNRLLFAQIQTLPPIMHHKWKAVVDLVCTNTNGKSQGTNSQHKIPSS